MVLDPDRFVRLLAQILNEKKLQLLLWKVDAWPGKVYGVGREDKTRVLGRAFFLRQ